MRTINLVFLALCAVCVVAGTEVSEFGWAKEFGSNWNSRIVGGEDAVEGQFPYQISFRVRFTNSHYCGGSILTSRFLLTAAHCTQGSNTNPQNVYVVVGTHRRLSGGVVYDLDRILPHKGFTMNKIRNDISLLRTAKDIVFTDKIQPIALPTENTPGELQVLLSGWGRTSYPSGGLPDILQFTEPKTLTVEACIKRFSGTTAEGYIHASNLCTINKSGVGACHGDSGGPLVDATNPANKIVVGIVSWGFPCARGYPDAFTRVHYFLDWIHENMAEQSQDF